MTPVVISFLALEAIIILIGTLLGLKRGLGKSVIRTIYLLVVGVVSYFLSRLIISKISVIAVDKLHSLYPEDLKTLIEASPDVEVIITTFVAALIVPICFGLIFGLLQLLSLIGFGAVARKLLGKLFPDKEKGVASRCAGAAVGFVTSVFVAAALLSPMFVTISVVRSIPDETLASVGIPTDMVSVEDSQGATLAVRPSTTAIHHLAAETTSTKMPGILVVDRLMVSALTTFKTPLGKTTNAYSEIPHVAQMAVDMVNAHNTTVEKGGDELDAITNALAVLSLYVDESTFVKEFASDALSAVGKYLQEHNSIFGVELIPVDDSAFGAIMQSFIDTTAKTTPDTVKKNIATLFGQPTLAEGSDQYHNSGIVSAFAHMNIPEEDLDEEAAQKRHDVVADAFTTLADNEAMEEVLDQVSEYASQLINENAAGLVEEDAKEVYEEVVNQVSDTIVAVQDLPTAEKVEVVKEIIDSALDEFHMEIEDWQSTIVATCAVKEFCDGDYLDENGNPTVSIEDIMSFFGVSEAEIPEWAK